MNSYITKTKNKFHNAVMSLKSKLFKVKQLHSPQILTTERDTSFDPKNHGKIEVLVFGSINMQYLTFIHEHPKVGETVKAMYREQCFGGRAANQSVAAAKLGANCALISKLGNDDLGNIYYEYLQQVGVIVEFIQLVEGQETGHSQINIDDNSKNTTVEWPGANLMLTHKDISRCKRGFYEAKVFLCQLDPDYKTVQLALKQFRKTSILNASPACKDLPLELIRAPTILCMKREDAAVLTEREEIKFVQDAKEAAQDLIAKGARNVIITMGAQGAVFLSQTEPDTCIHCPAAPVRYFADASGASDAFLGSLAYHMVLFPKLNLENHIHAANLCAAYAVGHRGAQPSFPGPELTQDNLCKINPVFYVIQDETPEQKEARVQKAAEAAQVKPEPVPETSETSEPVPIIPPFSTDIVPAAVTAETAAAPAAAAEPAPASGPAPTSSTTATVHSSGAEAVEPAPKPVADKQVQRASEVAAAMVSTRNTQGTAPAVVPRMVQRPRRVTHKKRTLQKSHAH